MALHEQPSSAPAEAAARFCTRCGTVSRQEAHERLRFERVCADCGMGVYLSCPADPLPPSFLIVTGEGLIAAVSDGAEAIVGPEPGLVGSALGSLLTADDGGDVLERAVRRAALGMVEESTLFVRVASPEGRALGRIRTRIFACGPPRAALVTIEIDRR